MHQLIQVKVHNRYFQETSDLSQIKKKVFTNKNSQNNVSVQLSGGRVERGALVTLKLLRDFNSRFDDAVSEHFRVAHMVQLDVL